jgi:hypothetical protein
MFPTTVAPFTVALTAPDVLIWVPPAAVGDNCNETLIVQLACGPSVPPVKLIDVVLPPATVPPQELDSSLANVTPAKVAVKSSVKATELAAKLRSVLVIV